MRGPRKVTRAVPESPLTRTYGMELNTTLSCIGPVSKLTERVTS